MTNWGNGSKGDRASSRQQDDFIATAVHDLKSPLSVIKLRLQMLRKSPERALEYLDVMEYQLERMENLVNDMALLSRLEAGVITTELVLVDLKHLARQVYRSLEPIAQEKRLRFRLEEPCEALPPVLADERQLERVIVNLVSNAIRYTPEKGIVMLATGCNEGRVIIAVDDNGIGIDPTDQPHIFNRFYRGHNHKAQGPDAGRGSGLGLAIVQEIVEAHNGLIQVHSQKGQGSSFTVALPIYQPPSE